MIQTETITTPTTSNDIWSQLVFLDQFVIMVVIAILLIVVWAWSMIKYSERKNNY